MNDNIKNNYLDIEIDEIKSNEDLVLLLGDILDNNDSDIFKNETEESIVDYAKIELSSFPTEISISSGMTRQKVQYCPNTYHGSIKIDISQISDFIIDRISNAPSGTKVDTFVKLRKYHYQSLLYKIDKHEMLLRRALISRARADNTALPEDK